MEVEVIDDADKRVEQQANGGRQNGLVKRGQGVHVGTSMVAYPSQAYICRIKASDIKNTETILYSAVAITILVLKLLYVF